MSENGQSEPVKTTHRMRGFLLSVGLQFVAFLAGFIWMGLKSRRCSRNLSDAEQQSCLAQVQNPLGSAAIDARRGDYETARVAAGDFFTALRAEMDRGVDSALTQDQVAGVQPLLAQRDEIITLLAREDAASADLLSEVYVSFRRLVNP